MAPATEVKSDEEIMDGMGSGCNPADCKVELDMLDTTADGKDTESDKGTSPVMPNCAFSGDCSLSDLGCSTLTTTISARLGIEQLVLN